MNTCDTCKWWGDECKPSIKSYRYCARVTKDDGTEPPDGFTVTDGEPFNEGTFATGPKFGCVHWEARL